MVLMGLCSDIKRVMRGRVPDSLWVVEVFPEKMVIIFTPKNEVAEGFCFRLSVQKFKMLSPN